MLKFLLTGKPTEIKPSKKKNTKVFKTIKNYLKNGYSIGQARLLFQARSQH